jgi:hypothetical protein
MVEYGVEGFIIKTEITNGGEKWNWTLKLN